MFDFAVIPQEIKWLHARFVNGERISFSRRMALQSCTNVRNHNAPKFQIVLILNLLQKYEDHKSQRMVVHKQ